MAASKTECGTCDRLQQISSRCYILNILKLAAKLAVLIIFVKPSCMVVSGAVDFHPGKIWTDTDGDLVQVSKFTG